MKKILIIQTAFIGDVILATGVLEKLHNSHPDAKIDFLLRKGNEGLFQQHPFLNKLLIWNKKEGKLKNLFKTIQKIRKERYDLVVNIHRFASSGIITAFSKGKIKVGFNKNPLSFAFTKKMKHEIDTSSAKVHEIDRNDSLIIDYTTKNKPYIRLYPSEEHLRKVEIYQNKDYICIAPTSVWFTKQYPSDCWVDVIHQLKNKFAVYLLGAPGDFEACQKIVEATGSQAMNLCGKLSFLESAALMRKATMNFVNDSAPLHIASAVNAPVTAIFCSTVPAFGFGPLSENSKVVETKQDLKCRPCGLHGHKECPEKHFKCAYSIEIEQVLF